MTFDQDGWCRILCEVGVRPQTASKWSAAFADEIQPEKFSAGMADLRAFLPQVLHETGMLERTMENLLYTSPDRIAAVWPTRFPTVASAVPYVAAPRKLASRVYADRMGNGNEASGDGARFSGRGLIMVTGRANYAALGDRWGQDLTVMPELLEQPHFACQGAVLWWEGHIPDSALGDTVQCRRRVNGGTIGLSHCAQLADLVAKVLA